MNEPSINHKNTCRRLKCILLSKRSQSEKLHNVYFQVYGIQEKAKVGTVKACYKVKKKKTTICWVGYMMSEMELKWKYKYLMLQKPLSLSLLPFIPLQAQTMNQEWLITRSEFLGFFPPPVDGVFKRLVVGKALTRGDRTYLSINTFLILSKNLCSGAGKCIQSLGWS